MLTEVILIIHADFLLKKHFLLLMLKMDVIFVGNIIFQDFFYFLFFQKKNKSSIYLKSFVTL